ncbi:MAG: HEAT repeat domain-containing protein [Gemmataceae bacterium]|nr:HEAT repeat domain-containing protein [Gemmataceae bacterium]
MTAKFRTISAWLGPALFLLGSLALTGPCFSQAADPFFQGKKLSEWLDSLKTEADYSKLPEKEKLNQSRSRRAGLIAVELLSGSLDQRILPALEKVAKGDPEEKLREASALALARVALKHAEKSKSEAPREFAARALESILENEKSNRVREASAQALGKLGPVAARAVPALGKCLQLEDPGLRAAAADTLRRLGMDALPAIGPLRTLAADGKADLISRAYAILALGNLADEESVPLLLGILADGKLPVDLRMPAGNALAAMGDSAAAAAPKLGELLVQDAFPRDLKRVAAIALDNFGLAAAPAIPSLVAALKDRDATVRAFCLHALGGLGAKLGSNLAAARRSVFHCLDDSALEVRLAALETFGRWGPGLADNSVLGKIDSLTMDPAKEIRETAQVVRRRLNSTNDK